MFMVWLEPTNPNQTVTSAMEQKRNETSATKRIYNRSSHSQEVDEQINRPQVTSKANQHFQDSSQEADEKQGATHLILANMCLLSSSSKRSTRTSIARTRMTRATTSWHASSDHQTLEINGGLSMVSRKAMTTVTRQHPRVV